MAKTNIPTEKTVREIEIERLQAECKRFEAKGEFDTAHHRVLANLLNSEPQKKDEADNG
jgi:hypothetical protein